MQTQMLLDDENREVVISQQWITDWRKPEQFPLLKAQSVHVWCVRLEATAAEEIDWTGILSADERERARRYVFAGDRRRYITCRAALRQILGAYAGLPPESIAFRYGPHGKPELAVGRSPLDFNVSHEQDLALIAVSRSGPLGIDIASVRPLKTDMRGLAAIIFTQAEQLDLAGLDPSAALTAFFRGWTRKEAILKANGVGLHAPVAELHVGVIESHAPLYVRWPPEARLQSFWRLHSLRLDNRLIATLATTTKPLSIDCYLWSNHGSNRWDLFASYK
jgi:4'-phosphopantetheinyl transferase